MHIKRVLELLLVLLVIQLILAPQTYAYLDPGTGSYAFQVLLAALVAGLYLLKTFWRRITGMFVRRQRNKDA